MQVEFFGLPGAGKTYLAEKLSKKNNIDLVYINNTWQKGYFLFLFIINNLKLFFILFNKFIKENSNNTRLLFYKIKHLFFLMAAREQKAKFYKKSIVDDGFVQMLFTIYEREISYEDLEWCKKYFKNYYVYIVESDKEKRLERIKTRNRTPREFFGEKYAEDWLLLVEKNYPVIKKFIKDNFNYKKIQN